MLKLIPITVNSPDDDWIKYFNLLVRMKNKYGSSLRSDSWQEFKKKMVSHFEVCEEPFLEAVISDGDKFLSWLIFIVNNAGTKDQDTIIVFEHDSETASPPILKLIAKQYSDWMDQYNCAEAIIMAESERVYKTSLELGAELLQEFSEYMLSREKLNRTAVELWTTDIPKQNSDLRIEHCNEIPDGLLEKYCELHSIFLADMPEEKKTARTYKYTATRYLDRKKWRSLNDIRVYHTLLFDKNDNLIGLSAAEINTIKQDEVYQYMTGLLSEYRSRGLSRWLKAALIKSIESDFPEYGHFQTMMRAVNEPIQKVNKELGYEFVRKGYELRLTPEMLVTILKK